MGNNQHLFWAKNVSTYNIHEKYFETKSPKSAKRLFNREKRPFL